MAKEILSKKQLLILKKAAQDDFISENFYLTGGTALAGFYLNHRVSEDLDFFSEKEFDVLGIDIFLKKQKKDLKISSIDFQQSYNRNLFFLRFQDKEMVKIEFTYFPFPHIEKPKKKSGVKIDSPIDIATNKLFTIYQQSRARDYIDLYFIVKKYGWSIKGIVKKAKIKFDWHIDPLQLGSQFLKADSVSDFPIMIKKISKKEWQEFFIKEAEELKNQILI